MHKCKVDVQIDDAHFKQFKAHIQVTHYQSNGYTLVDT